MLYRGRRYINTCFVSVFRQIFKNHPQFPWDENKLQEGLFINESWPRGERKFPAIICNDVTDGDFFQASFDSNFQEDVKDDRGNIIGSIYGYTLKPTIQVTISALTKYDAEMIADFICGFMQYSGLNKFADAGLIIVTATGSTPQSEEYGKNNIYTINLTYNLQAEWQQYISNDEVIDSVVIPSIDILDRKEDPTVIQNEPGIIITKEEESE